jgi:hypothetical protein
MWLLLEKGGFQNILVTGPLNDPLPKKKVKKCNPQLTNTNLQKGMIVKGI